ncbi:hypothetical protein KI387_036592, partial [Taxus chinensis]
VVARIIIDACHWLPVSMEFNVLGQADRWEYRDWNSSSLGFNHKFPHSCVHYPAGGGRHSYTIYYSTLNSGDGNTVRDKVENDYLYAFPKTSIVPRCNKFYPKGSLDISRPAAVKMIHARSGHLLVRPLIDGKDIGYFLLDTGASGLGICPKQVASNSSTERNWSTYSFIHLAKRNKLESKKAENLVYVHSNLCILSHKIEGYIRGPNNLWDIDPESSDFDTSAATLSQISRLGIDEEESGSIAQGMESEDTKYFECFINYL